jgi:hypothetical protein
MDDAEYLANQELLQGANRKANLHNTLAAVAAMSNNAGAAAAAKMAAADQQRQYGPQKLGAMGYMLPDTGEFVGSKLYADEKKAAAEEKRSALAASLAAKAEAERIRSEDRAQQRALMLTIAGMKSGDARYKVDNTPPKGAGGKTLPAPTINKLSDAEGMAAGFADLAGGFQDQYGGGYGTMTVQNFLGKNAPNSKYADQSNWWQNYNDQKNLIRNKLFGSALTASEKKAFDDANITEGMSAAEIRKRLGQQHAATVRARNKLVQNYGSSGYDVSGFEVLPEPDYVKPGTPSRSARDAASAATAAPAGIDPIVWNHMTPQEKALFK